MAGVHIQHVVLAFRERDMGSAVSCMYYYYAFTLASGRVWAMHLFFITTITGKKAPLSHEIVQNATPGDDEQNEHPSSAPLYHMVIAVRSLLFICCF